MDNLYRLIAAIKNYLRQGTIEKTQSAMIFAIGMKAIIVQKGENPALLMILDNGIAVTTIQNMTKIQCHKLKAPICLSSLKS